ncbi:MAG: MurR/RpiR family transcriptional regulator [Sphingomonas adhaesiva]|uniref:MurR/RpiR family transcriptional regulator n=1 Tax=Sphingomonas adhaesiva TaxID=28212 RepID=UPI002FF52111
MPASDAESLKQEIIRRFPTLSKRLQQVASHAIDHPGDFAVETLATIAERSGVQPSTIVRFAKTFGFDGASTMQRLFRDQLVDSRPALGYRQRIQRGEPAWDGMRPILTPQLLGEFIDNSVASLQALADEGSIAFIDATIAALREVDTVYVLGFRRSFPIASYFGYALSKAGKRVAMIDGLGGMQREQLAGAGPRDLVIATSFTPYADETVELCTLAAEAGAALHVITDSALSPVARVARHAAVVTESEVRGFRSLPATLCLAQTIVVGYLYATERPG